MPSIIPKVLLVLIAVLSILGFFDASYLTAKHYGGGIEECILGGTDCGQVTSSKYATMAGTPISLFGAGYYLAIFFLALTWLSDSRLKFVRWIALLSGVGFIASLYLVYLQIYVIEAICTYCMFSAGTTTLIFIVSLFQYLREKKFNLAQ